MDNVDPWCKANLGVPLHSAEHTASKLLEPDLGTFADWVQVDTNVMLLPAIPCVDEECEANLGAIGNQGQADVTLLASLRHRGH